jgi:hypothetical protein
VKPGRGAVVALWCAVAWIPFPAGFVLVSVMDPRQGDRTAFANGVGIAAVASLPMLVLWLVAMLLAASSARGLPGFGTTMGLLVGAGVIGATLSLGIGGALAPFGGLVVIPALGLLVILLFAVPLAYIAVRAVAGVPVNPLKPDGRDIT